MPMHVPPTGTPDNMGCTATSVNDRSLENVNVKHVLQRLFCCHAQGYLKQTTFSYSAVFAQHCINLNSPKNAIRTHHSHNTQHTSGTRKKKSNLRTWSPNETEVEPTQYKNSKVRWKNSHGTNGNKRLHQEQKTPWQCLTHDMSQLSRRSKAKGLSATLFFCARFALFCARFACFRARFAQKSWMLFDHIRQHQVRNVTITHVKADLMQGAILCSQRVHGPTVSCSHATGRRIFAMIF